MYYVIKDIITDQTYVKVLFICKKMAERERSILLKGQSGLWIKRLRVKGIKKDIGNELLNKMCSKNRKEYILCEKTI